MIHRMLVWAALLLAPVALAPASDSPWAACLKGRQTVAVLRYHWGPPMETKHPLNRVIDYLLKLVGFAGFLPDQRASARLLGSWL